MGALASRMKPGTWEELKTEGFGQALLECGDKAHSILEWTGKGTWDPNTKQFLYIGQGHYADQKFITYSAPKNTWTVQPRPYWDPTGDPQKIPSNIGHAFEHNAIDPVAGAFYYRRFGGKTIYRLDVAKASWTELPHNPDYGDRPSTWVSWGALEYFPERKGLLSVDGRTAYFFDSATGRWEKVGTDLPIGVNNHFASYNPVHKVILFGGGYSRKICKLDSSGRISPLKDAPIELGIYKSVVTPDPASGKYLVFGGDGAHPGRNETFYEYEITSDTWTLQNQKPLLFEVSLNPVFYTAAAPVANYGVTLYVTYNRDTSKVLLYKHSAGLPKRKGK